MRFEDTDLKTSFTVSDALTVRQMLVYRGALGSRAGQELFIRAWEAAVPLIEDWKSEVIPNLADFDLDKSTDPAAVPVLMWAGISALNHITSLERVEKN